MDLFIFLLLSLVSLVRADTPGNCMYADILGTWTFSETERDGDNSISCEEGALGDTVYTKTFTLHYPDVVTDELGNQGTWTMIYNQGFEVNINRRSYFAFSKYDGGWISSTSYCDQTFPGWARDDTIRNWSCFTTEKTTKVAPRVTERQAMKNGNKMFKNDYELISRINKAQSSWFAKSYPEFETYTRSEMAKRAGGPWASQLNVSSKKQVSSELKKRVSMLPKSFDWRNVEGVSYVSDIRDQMSCGSCYAFASMANLEAQIRIATKNERQDVYSPQDIVDCTYLAQGCEGGFDFLIAGRYGMEQGVVSEECNAYNGHDGECSTDTTCSRTYVSAYQHVGGYYGACNEEEMLMALQDGPVSVSFQVEDDFHNYGGGIYHHTGLKNDFNPFEVTNHVVLVVGYGEDESTHEKFWIVKNSWGSSWGEDGYFRIRRGTDEVAIESMAVTVTIIP